MTISQGCPPFLEPRLRLFLSADIVGSTSLKQTRARPGGSIDDSTKGPVWFSAIQGFYFEAAQAFISEWSTKKSLSEQAKLLYGEEPSFWKSIGDEVLFTKLLSDHRQLTTTLHCWFTAVMRMRKFLKNENSTLDVKCTAWVAGFPYRNREVVINRALNSQSDPIENYYKENGDLLNRHYQNNGKEDIIVDYIGPSIDTGFRLTNFSSGRKMTVSVDVAYLISMTSFDGEVRRIDMHYDGSHTMKGVMGGASYPVFWINMSGESSLAVKEDRLRMQTTANREDIKEFCDAFYHEYSSFTFRPFIKDDIGQTLARMPNWYNEYHKLLVKNFSLPDNEYLHTEPGISDSTSPTTDADFDQIIEQIEIPPLENNKISFVVGNQVSHQKFGKGLIRSIENNVVTVAFEKSGVKRVLSAFLQVNLS